jgi:hypothetical protein
MARRGWRLTFTRWLDENAQNQLALFAWLISHQPAVLFSQNKPATSNQPAVLSSQNKLAPAISHQPTEQADNILMTCALGPQKDKPIWTWEKTKFIQLNPCMLTSVERMLEILIKESGKQKNSSKNKNFHVAYESECNINKRQPSKKEFGRAIIIAASVTLMNA